VRLRSGSKSIKTSSLLKQVVTRQPTSFGEEISKAENVSQVKSKQVEGLNGKDLNLALTFAIEEVANKVQKKGNKFTEGLDLSQFDDWASELRPSMKKLRQGLSLLNLHENIGSHSTLFVAMDTILKTARIIHSVQRLQQDIKKTSSNLAIMFRRDVCLSQAVRETHQKLKNL
jgi:hypothetical protein